MKKIAIAAAISLAATTAFAGGMMEPKMEAKPVVAEAKSASSSGGILVPVLILLLVAAAVSN